VQAMLKLHALLTLFAAVHAHVPQGFAPLPINKELGVPGFPDCVNPYVSDSLEKNAFALECDQKKTNGTQITIGCIGDSITAGVHSSGGVHTYPGQLQQMLDQQYPGKYAVTNLGACGSTMMKGADSPYWKRPQYTTLTGNKWDILIIMLGTNDAKDAGSHGPHNWPHNCTGADALSCPYAVDYLAMIELVKTLGTAENPTPTIYTAIPPPLMQQGAYGMNQTVINDVLPALVPKINAAANINTKIIDVFSALGGEANWRDDYPSSCTTSSTCSGCKCPLFCDQQSCDQCHPDDNGYTAMAAAMKAGLGL